MQLLDKKSIVQQKNLERKREIDEGAKLAQKIDTLRETSSLEEVKLNKIRTESISQLKKDILVLSDQKDGLKSEIQTLSDQRDELKKPLTLEWEKLDQEKEKIVDSIQELNKLTQSIGEKEVLLTEKLKDLELTKRSMGILELDLKNLIDQNQEIQSESIRVLETSVETAKGLERVSNQREKELNDKEKTLEEKERDIINCKEVLNSKEEDLQNRERLLKDRYQTLERTLNRIKKHGNS